MSRRAGRGRTLLAVALVAPLRGAVRVADRERVQAGRPVLRLAADALPGPTEPGQPGRRPGAARRPPARRQHDIHRRGQRHRDRALVGGRRLRLRHAAGARARPALRDPHRDDRHPADGRARSPSSSCSAGWAGSAPTCRSSSRACSATRSSSSSSGSGSGTSRRTCSRAPSSTARARSRRSATSPCRWPGRRSRRSRSSRSWRRGTTSSARSSTCARPTRSRSRSGWRASRASTSTTSTTRSRWR